MQFLALVALTGVDGHPLNVVLRQHGMLHGADLYADDAAVHRPGGDMLLHSGVGGAGDDLRHLLAAADHRHTAVLDLGNDIAAVPANEKSLLHGNSPFLSINFPRI